MDLSNVSLASMTVNVEVYEACVLQMAEKV